MTTNTLSGLKYQLAGNLPHVCVIAMHVTCIKAIQCQGAQAGAQLTESNDGWG